MVPRAAVGGRGNAHGALGALGVRVVELAPSDLPRDGVKNFFFFFSANNLPKHTTPHGPKKRTRLRQHQELQKGYPNFRKGGP